MVKVTVAYNHDSRDLGAFHLALGRRRPVEEDWRPALRDTVNGRLVLWARFPSGPQRGEQVWLRHNGTIQEVAVFEP